MKINGNEMIEIDVRGTPAQSNTGTRTHQLRDEDGRRVVNGQTSIDGDWETGRFLAAKEEQQRERRKGITIQKLREMGPNFQLLFVVRQSRPLSIQGAVESLGLTVSELKLGLRRLRIDIYRQLQRMGREK